LKRLFYLLFIFFFLFTRDVKAVDFDKVDRSNGLRTNCVHDFIYDDGKMYIFTKFGIEIWDGYRVRKFILPKEINSSEIIFSRKDAYGRIWFSTVNGILAYIYQDKVFLIKRNNKIYQSDSWVVSMNQNSLGESYFLLFSKKIIKIDSLKKISEIVLDDYSTFVSDIYIDRDNIVSGFSASFFFKYKDNKVHKDYSCHGVFPVSKLLRLDSSRLVYQKGDKLFLFNTSKNNIFMIAENFDGVVNIYFSGGYLFISDNLKVSSFRVIGDIASKSDIYDVPDVSNVKIGFDGSLIFSTLNEGIFVLNKQRYKSFYPFGKNKSVFSLSVIGDKVFIGGFYGNLCYVDKEYFFRGLGVPQKLYSSGLGRVFRVTPFQSKILVCYEQRGLVFDNTLKSGRIISFGVRNFCEFNNGFLYSSSRDIHFTSPSNFQKTIVGRFSNSKMGFRTDYIDLSSSSLAPYLRPYSFCRVDGSVLIGTNKGLYQFDSTTSSLRNDYKSIDRFSRVSDVKRISKDLVALVVNDFKVFVLNFNSGEILVKIPFSNGMVQKIFNIDNKSFWFCTDDGLFLCTFKDGFKKYSLRRFSTHDGLLSDEVNDIAFARGKWWIATSKGLSLLNADFYKVKREPAPMPTYYSFYLNGKPADSLKDKEFVGLSSIGFSFGCLSLQHLGNLKFRYRLSPTSGWIQTDKADHELNSLSPGDYRIEVQACSPNSVWSASLYYPQFRILPPFWQRGWVILSISAFFFSIAFALVYNVQRIRIARIQLESEMTDASLKSIRTQMKPHFLSNILNSMHYFILSEKPEDSGNFVSSFSRLVRHMLDSSDKNYLPLHPELVQLRDYFNFECKRMNREVALNIHFQKDADFSNVMIPGMLLQPLIENSLMHGIFPVREREGVIDVFIGKVESGKFQKMESDRIRVSWKGRLIIQVKDNGQGREASRAVRHRRFSHSYGVRGITDRLLWIKRKFRIPAYIEIHDLKDQHGSATGTAVVLNLPLMESAGKPVA